MPKEEEIYKAFSALDEAALIYLDSIVRGFSDDPNPSAIAFHNGRRSLAAELLGYAEPYKETKILKNIDE
jgi:hypothetical protein